MSLWLCPIHGVISPMACCERAEFARIAGSITTPTSIQIEYFYPTVVPVEAFNPSAIQYGDKLYPMPDS